MKDLLVYLRLMKGDEERIEYLAKEYPCLYIFILQKLGHEEELRHYMQKCETYEYDYKKYSLYIHGYWLPYLKQAKESGLLKQGKTYFQINKEDFTYEGLIDKGGSAFGQGTAISKSNPNKKITGTFYSNSPHGIVVSQELDPGVIFVYECNVFNKTLGKGTKYQKQAGSFI